MDRLNILPIKNKLLLFFSFFILIIFIICVYASVYIDSTEAIFVSSVSVNKDVMALIRSTSSIKYFGEQVIESNNYENLNQYIQFSEGLKNQLSRLEETSISHVYLINYENIIQMIGTYLDQMDKAINAARFSEIGSARDNLSDASRTFKLIEDAGTRFSNQVLEVTVNDYERVVEIQAQFRRYVSVMIGLIILYAYIYIYYFSNNITEPLEQIAKRAKEISAGDFSTADIAINTNDELVLIGDAFNKMNHDIIRLLEEERMKVQWEKAWRDAELRALQAQLNPHFLFNTLNIITQKAILNDIQKTTKLIKSLSKILRYNLSEFDVPVTIREEMDIVREYGEIMNARYNNKIMMHYSVDYLVYDLSIPRMIIQPLVENCLIHGYNASVRKEMTIEVRIFKQDNVLNIHVWDDGVGFDAKAIRKAINPSPDDDVTEHRGHTTGIGIGNIQKRLEMIFHSQNIITIESEKMAYSLVKLALPMYGEENNDV